jgi:hypothetical protein
LRLIAGRQYTCAYRKRHPGGHASVRRQVALFPEVGRSAQVLRFAAGARSEILFRGSGEEVSPRYTCVDQLVPLAAGFRKDAIEILKIELLFS